MMTTMAAMLGGVPLMLGHGTGAEIRQPLGYAMVGGLLVSQALTLFTTPVIYLYLDRLSNWLSGEAEHGARKAEGEAAVRGAGRAAPPRGGVRALGEDRLETGAAWRGNKRRARLSAPFGLSHRATV